MATKKSTARKSTKQATRKSATPPSKRWSSKVDTDSTHHDHGLFLKSPRTIANALATTKVSPKGPASGMRMLNFYINRAGKNLSRERVAELEKAKQLLSDKIAKKKDESTNNATAKKKSVKVSERKDQHGRPSGR